MAHHRESIFAWRKAKGDTTGVRSIALKARENLRQTRETRRRSLGICHARFLRYEIYRKCGRKAKEQ